MVHEEVGRLPERYREAVVLCLLEGLTPEQAARHLNCPVGTVHSRLARGRERLRGRLTRRGLAVPAGLLAVGWAPERRLGGGAASTGGFDDSSRAAARSGASFGRGGSRIGRCADGNDIEDHAHGQDHG